MARFFELISNKFITDIESESSHLAFYGRVEVVLAEPSELSAVVIERQDCHVLATTFAIGIKNEVPFLFFFSEISRSKV